MKSRIFWGIVAPVAAIVTSLLLISGILLLKHTSPVDILKAMIDYGFSPRNIVAELNIASGYYIAGVAAAIGFKMMLFNIGIDGQYRLAVFFAAVVGGLFTLPPVLHVTLIILVGAIVGGLWGSIAGYLKVKRGISEVISNIMLNAIAAGLVAYLLQPTRLGEQAEGSNNLNTPIIAPSGQLPTIPFLGGQIHGFIIFTVFIGLAYWVLLNKSTFGFNLRATGLSFKAARAGGVNAPKMIFVTMALSGAIAGLTGMGTLLSETHSYSISFPSGYALTGLALALLGRNHPVGIAFAAYFWAFLDRSAGVLDLNGVPKEIITIMQGTIVLSIVVAYEIVKRINKQQEQKLVGSASATLKVSATTEGEASA
ncbi:unannotated protein [freshwater metagenome]|uniref:Unannotated protein n=1 Tax=freshwater metagenome TaxID=449393 RepID=A0A6J7XY67_9ZZZZ|nr:ABC transporter permease [Actinomycetota bacterium]